MKDIEIEIQVRVENVAQLESFLKSQAEFTNESHQKDEYFTPAHRNFAAPRPVVEWLRLRTSKTNSVAYKKWHYEGVRSQYCDEFETIVADIGQLRKIFTALNMTPVVTVKKIRRTWNYQNYEIALNHVTGLGNFIEIEYKGHEASADPKTVTDDMIALLKKHGCGQIKRNFVGYAFMLLEPNEATFEEVV